MNIIKAESKFNCVIPFYNESLLSIVRNIREVLKVTEIGLKLNGTTIGELIKLLKCFRKPTPETCLKVLMGG